jgi:DNA-binding beta-propeller fold protein YncE
LRTKLLNQGFAKNCFILSFKYCSEDINILLKNSDSLNQVKRSYKMDTGIYTIITSIQKFGKVVVESKPCELSFVRGKDRQAQLMVAEQSTPMSVENIQLKLKQKINIKGSSIRGCSFLSDGRMAFSCDKTDTVTFINKEGAELFQIGKDKIGSSSYDKAYIKDNNSVAVSCGRGSNRCIAIIDIESKKVMAIIPMDTNIYGMAVRGRAIYYCSSAKELKMLNLSDKSVSDIISSDKSNFLYVATSGDKLYYTVRNTDTVTCCNLHGTPQWEFTDGGVLCSSYGISVDNDGNVYVVCCRSSNVVVISTDGRRHRQLLSSEDGLKNPRAIDYDKSTNRLLVVNESQYAFLFDVAKGE